MAKRLWAAGVLGTALALASGAGAAAADFSLRDVLSYPFVQGLTAAKEADRIAWVRVVEGVRNVWVADGPSFAPRAVTRYDKDDGQELTGLAFAPDGRTLLYVRGGDHDANWPAEGGLAPDPDASPDEPKVTIWSADLSGGKAPTKLAEGDAPAISRTGQVAYIKEHQVWTAPPGGAPRRLFFDKGKDSALAWSPDGKRLAFVSDRDDHAFIGVFAGAAVPIVYLAPSTGIDGEPVWSADGKRIAFTRRPGRGGPPEPILVETPHPWAIWTADAASGAGALVWRSPVTLRGSYPDRGGGAGLRWAAAGALDFVAEMDGWPHLYAVDAPGGAARLLTPGAFMVEDVAVSRDGKALVYSANTGAADGDDDRRHLFVVDIAGGAPRPLTAGAGLEWTPVATSGAAAFIAADAREPPAVAVIGLTGSGRRTLVGQAPPAAFPAAALVVPSEVAFTAADGVTAHGQLFAAADSSGARKPGVIFVHGGPPRQMLLGWHYMDYYANAYAVNQYLAAHGFIVLSVNYRLGIGYGREFQHPAHAGWAGAAEYQDVVAGARFLAARADVDAARIGIWGGSYGGYLTALALARDSALFKAGVDLHGVHDWSRIVAAFTPDPSRRFEAGDHAQAMATAWRASPDADIARWTSPVLLIQGDDDRNVRFEQTIDLARRLAAQGTPFEELVLPNEIHGFLRHASWLEADTATAAFLAKVLAAPAAKP